MEKLDLKVGLTASIETNVFDKDTAEQMGSGNIDVFATPAMVALMEKAALSAVELHLPVGCSTVGTSINVTHTAATPVGMKVKAVAELTGIEDRKLVFKVTSYDEVEKIGEGYHERYIITTERFRSKVYKKSE